MTGMVLILSAGPALAAGENKVLDEKAKVEIDNGLPVPVMNQFYMQLHGIDFELTRDFYPINEAIKKAIETVLQYYAYR